MDMKVTFPGGKVAEAHMGQMTIRTDQPVSGGGTGSAPSPFVLFLASIATCAGFYAVSFCQERDIPTEGMELNAGFDRDPTTHLLSKVTLDLKLPNGFPEKYQKAIIRTMDLCTVKQSIKNVPEFDIKVS